MTNLARTIPPPSEIRVNEIRALASVRGQAAFVRSLLDEVERLVPSGGPCPMSTQLAEELARLGCRILEVASALSAAGESPGEPHEPLAAPRCA